MTSISDPLALARALLAARRQRAPIDASAFCESLRTAEDAFTVQTIVWQDTAPAGAFARWWKSGGPSRDATLTHAPLPAQGVWNSPADAREWHFNFCLVEAEIALRLGRDVSALEAATLTPEAARGAIDAMAVSIELVDSRWQQRAAAPALLKLADLQSHGALAVGAWMPFAARDWATQACTVRIGTQAPREFRGTHSLADPAWLLPTWLRHLTRHGATVPAGTAVTTGTWCGMLPAAAGELVNVRFEGVGEVSVQL